MLDDETFVILTLMFKVQKNDKERNKWEIFIKTVEDVIVNKIFHCFHNFSRRKKQFFIYCLW